MAIDSTPPRERLAVAELQIETLEDRVRRIDEVRLPALEEAIREHREEAREAWGKVRGGMWVIGVLWTVALALVEVAAKLGH